MNRPIVDCSLALSQLSRQTNMLRVLHQTRSTQRSETRVAACHVVRVLFLAILLWGACSTLPYPVSAQDDVRKSVVKIHVTRQAPDLFRPWMRRTSQESSGTGVVIEGKRVLTNFHVVQYSREILVQGYQSADKIPATVIAQSPGMDLAILEVEDESFFDQRPGLDFAETLPAVKDTVNVYGYPVGGEQLSITEGIVSRIGFEQYYSMNSGLRLQVDAPLNPGNSGGPAMTSDQMVGLVFSKINKAENIGYLIPIEEIQLFLDDITDGNYDGKPRMFDDVQTVENDAIREKLGLQKGEGGVMVARPGSSDKSYPLHEWDTIRRIGNYAIDSDGKVKIEGDLRLSFRYLTSKLASDGKVPLDVLREGQEIKVEVPVRTEQELLMPPLNGQYPRYFIYGPLVFTAATQELGLMLLIDRRWTVFLTSHNSPLLARQFAPPAFEGEELVVAGYSMFPHRLTKGYSNPSFAVVSRVNGTDVKNLVHFVELLRDCQDEHIVFEFAGRGYEKLVFRRKEMDAATEQILEDNGIRHQYSEDLRAIWR